MTVYYERDGLEIEAFFEALPGVPTVPATVHWRLVSLTTGQALTSWAAVPYVIQTGVGGAITGVRSVIEVDGSLNVIRNRKNASEAMQIQVVAAKDTPRAKYEMFEYDVQRKVVR